MKRGLSSFIWPLVIVLLIYLIAIAIVIWRNGAKTNRWRQDVKRSTLTLSYEAYT